MADVLFPNPEHQPGPQNVVKYIGKASKHSLIPQHAVDLMNAQDAARAEYREFLDKNNLRETITDDAGNQMLAPGSAGLANFMSCISDFPTPENLAAAVEKQKQARIASEAREVALAKIEADRDHLAALPAWKRFAVVQFRRLQKTLKRKGLLRG